MAAGRPKKVETPAAMQKLADAYFDTCEAEEKPPTVNGLALALGFASRQSLFDYGNNPDFSYTLKGIRTRLESWWECKLAGNNVAGAIFWLKNQGWTDKSGLELSGPNGGPVQTEDVTKRDADEFARRMARLAASASASGTEEAVTIGTG